MSKEVLMRLQSDLKTAGYYSGDVDGLWGKQSNNAWAAAMGVLSGAKKDTTMPPVLDLAWSAKVSALFTTKVAKMATDLGCQSAEAPDWFMACMAWETGEKFTPDVKNPGSSATGLIQFMDATAKGMGTTTAALAKLTAEQQLDYVYKYFLPYKNRLKNLGDIYMAIIWPAGIGKSDDWVMWVKEEREKIYLANKGLDVNKDGKITRGECIVKVTEKLVKGRLPANRRVLTFA
jgi:hypothetical protein